MSKNLIKINKIITSQLLEDGQKKNIKDLLRESWNLEKIGSKWKNMWQQDPVHKFDHMLKNFFFDITKIKINKNEN